MYCTGWLSFTVYTGCKGTGLETGFLFMFCIGEAKKCPDLDALFRNIVVSIQFSSFVLDC
jgi:hypothetical protein